MIKISNELCSIDKSSPNGSRESHFKVKLEFDPLSQSFNKLSKPRAVLSTESPSSRQGRPVPPHPGELGARSVMTLYKKTARETKVLPFPVAVSVFQPCIHQLTLTDNTEGEIPIASAIATSAAPMLQAITPRSATIFPRPLLGFTDFSKTSLQCL